MCFKNILKHFRSSVTIPRVTQALQTIVERCCEKGQIWYEIPNFWDIQLWNKSIHWNIGTGSKNETRRYLQRWTLLILKYERHLKWERFVDENEIS